MTNLTVCMFLYSVFTAPVPAFVCKPRPVTGTASSGTPPHLLVSVYHLGFVTVSALCFQNTLDFSWLHPGHFAWISQDLQSHLTKCVKNNG